MLPNLLPITFIVANQKVMSTIRFSLRKDKKLKDGTAPIELVYQIKGQRKYYNTGFKTFPECWNADNQKAFYLDKKAAKKALPDVKSDLIGKSTQIDPLIPA